MKNYVLISMLFLFIFPSFLSAQYIKEYETNESVLYFSSDGMYLSDYKKSETILRFSDRYISDYKSGKTLYTLSSDGKYLASYDSGETILILSDQYVQDYKTGDTIWSISEGKYIKDYNTYNTLYYSDNPLNGIQLCMVFSALKWINTKGITYKSQKEENNTSNVKKSNINGTVNGKLEIGSFAAAKWSDGSWYLAVIKQKNGDSFIVDFTDGTLNYSVKKTDIKPLTESLSLKKGDKVTAVWAEGAKFYSGVVDKVEKNGAVIRWDDGTAPSHVDSFKIMKL